MQPRLRAKGSFTVEAALIMPIILGVIVLLIYISMNAYGKCAKEYAYLMEAEREAAEYCFRPDY